MKAVYAAACVNGFAAQLVRRDLKFSTIGIRMADVMSPLDHSKAERELGWSPNSVEESVRKAARFSGNNASRAVRSATQAMRAIKLPSVV